MPHYKSMYYQLAGKVADVIDILIAVQQTNEKTAMADDSVIQLSGNVEQQ